MKVFTRTRCLTYLALFGVIGLFAMHGAPAGLLLFFAIMVPVYDLTWGRMYRKDHP